MKKFTLFLMTMVLSMVGALSSFAQEPAAPKFSPVATDGQTVQYLYNVEAHAFVLGANDWNTRASVSVEKGYQFKVAANGNGTYTLNDYVETQSAWKAVFAGNPTDIWVDNLGGANVKGWVITEAGENLYKITNPGAGAGELAVIQDLSDTRLNLRGSNPGAYAATWAFVSEEDYAEYMANLDKAAVNAWAASKKEQVAEALKEEIKAANMVALDAMKAIIDGTNIHGEGWDEYVAKYNGYMEQIEAGTLSETVVNPSAATGWHSSTAFNFLLTPWVSSGKACNNFDNNLYINTWSVEGQSDGSNFLVPFFEYWTGDDASLGVNTLKTTVTGLVPGKTYTATAWVRVRIKNNGGAEANGITFQAGEGEAVSVCDGDAYGVMRVKEVTATGVADENGELVIAFNVEEGNNVSWLSYKNVMCEEAVELNKEISPAFIVEGEENPYTLNDHSSISVPSATALKVNFGDNPGVRTATYVINELVEDEFMGVVDVIEQEVASGLLSINNIGYVEFESPLTFYYGHKYNILIKAFAGDENTYWQEPAIATFTCEFNGATDAQPAVAMGQPNFGDRNISGMDVNPDEWEGLTISFPENNVASALAGTDAFNYGAVMLIGTDATLYEDSVAIAYENNAMSSEFSEVELFSNVELQPGKKYSVKIPVGGLKLVDMMNFMGDYDDSCVLWSLDEEIEFNFNTPEENLELVILPSLVLGDEEYAINNHSEISADVIDGLKVEFENGAAVRGVAYAVNAMKAVEDEEGTTWVVDESYDLAVGEMSINNIAVATFDEPIYLEQGNKYQIKITTFVANGEDSYDEVVTYYIVNGSHAPELAILPSLVLGDDEVAINNHSEVSVDVASGLKVEFENGAAVRGVAYAINAMKAVEDEEGTTWVADESYDLAVGEMSLNNVAYAEFDEPIYFEQGNKYQIKVTAFVANGTEEYDEVVEYYVINGSHALEIVVTPALLDGENEVTINSHSAVAVEAADAIKVNIENAPEAIGVTYLINEMNMGQDEEGTFWTVGKELAAGEASMNSIAYAEFETPLTFAYGKKYQLTVTVMGQPADDPQEIFNCTYEFNGATEVELAAGDYVIKNVESGLYLNGANSWGTKASATKHGQFMTVAKLEDGTYTIDTHYSNGGDKHYLAAGDNTFLDALPAYHTIEMVAPGIFTVKDSNDKYLAAGEDGLVNFNADEVTEAAKWQFITKEQILVALEDATADAPADATALIADADFSRNNTWVEKWNEKPGIGGANENMNAEKWGGNSNTFVSAQTVTDLPNGFYTLKFQGFYRYNNTTDNTNDVAAAAHADGTEVIYSYAFANNDSVALASIADDAAVEAYGKMPFSQSDASAAFALGLYQNEINFEVTDGTINIGVAKVEHIGCDWTVWDNFELYYNGVAPVIDMAVEPAFVPAEGEEVSVNSHSNVSVESAVALKVNVVGCPQASGISYVINEMNMGQDDEGTFWTVGQELAAGEANMNAIAYAEFDKELVFEYGKKYQLTVTVYSMPNNDEIGTYYYEFNGAWESSAPDLAELVGKVVYIQNAATGEYLYGKDAQNTAVGSMEAANAGVVTSYKLEANEDGTYSFRCVTPAGGDYALWGANPCYLNSQPNVGGVSFNLGKDQDIANGSSWNLIYDEASESWKIQSAANEGYLAGTTISADAEQTWVLVDAETTAINGVATSTVANGKYFVNGKVVIVNNGVKYNVAGSVIR